ncbi:hypothetical protein D8B22_19020 [Verminephrobacter aporrectodeae subsp. tuberculatae]|uniref:hypothetical protein n=1 Tax=Verminephrobacter aporrectodeae TaxID=1110389 RepID=UPI002243420B|nr:hypothetical protein [Verminephrobacter aporrectodeae]MCW8166714.1 hypothetical protein [Verminephrobacter aporrectodeae subsp. tuberculatae]MCW8171144.1 hypothetical protein [Verminephrobacter aporrectodeae subsp. tuberculatae]
MFLYSFKHGKRDQFAHDLPTQWDVFLAFLFPHGDRPQDSAVLNAMTPLMGVLIGAAAFAEIPSWRRSG